MLTRTTNVLVRVYILKVSNIVNLKGEDLCDSYIKIKLGDQTINVIVNLNIEEQGELHRGFRHC